MQRTYKSKKDTTRLNVLDEKQHAFEAFYIHNIKQAKRELSSIASRNQNLIVKKPKPRRRKYVKRIVTDVKPYGNESVAKLTYLTPDKSIHVKRNDLFDQLLGSTLSPKKHDSATNDESHNFVIYKEDKIESSSSSTKYKRIKNNFSSTSEDSDKENQDKTTKSTSNVTDIRRHQLIIETDTKRLNSEDLSINNLVNNIYLLKDLEPNASYEAKSAPYISLKNHRLTENLKTPEKGSYPTTSTPCLKKNVRNTAHNFSPILLDEGEKSPKHYCNIEFMEINKLCDKATNITLQDRVNSRNSTQHEKTQENNVKENSLQISFLKDLSENMNNHSTRDSEITDEALPSFEKAFKSGTQTKHSKTDNSGDSCGEIERESLKSNSSLVIKKSLTSYEPRDVTNIELFHGFPNTPEGSEGNFKPISPSISLYDTCSSLDSPDRNYHQMAVLSKEPRIYIQRLNDSLFQKYLEKMPSYIIGPSQHCSVSIKNVINLDNIHQDEEQPEIHEDLLHSTDLLNETKEKNSYKKTRLYNDDFAQNVIIERDIHNSTQKSLRLFDGLGKNSFSEVYKLNDSHFEENVTVGNDLLEEKSNQSVLQEALTESFNSTYESSTASDEDNSENEFKTRKDNEYISFVTTRKRNYVTNNSVIIMFDDPSLKITNTCCDESITNTATYKPVENIGTNNENPTDLIKSDVLNDCRNENRELIKAPVEYKVVRYCDETVAKPHIVLQSGKKWERSLSIYKRMTLLKEQFDVSALDEIPLGTKGRNYRQSVINTMEMQEFHRDPRPSDSSDWRSSFSVYKPSRSTIRIEPDILKFSSTATSKFEESRGFLSEDCDDTLIELSKLSITDADHEVTVLEKVEDTSLRVPSALDYVLRRCNQTEPILFDECYPDKVLKNCHKIGEGVYGEVFLWRASDGRARVMKVVPVGGSTRVNGEPQKDFAEIISEIIIAMELSALRAPIALIDQQFDEGKDVDALDLHTIENATEAFNQVLAVRCVYGSYPARLLDLWDLYDECKGSENDNPAILPPDQHYIVLELANAGQDLESYVFNNAEQAYYLFVQIAFALAVAEEAYQFEHRDLHWGNVLIASTDKKYCSFVLRGRTRRVPLHGAQATIIDYSLSRVSLPVCGGGAGAAGGGGGVGVDHVTLYNDLSADDSLFNAVGDYQFDVYRLMKNKLGNEWKNFEPYTNILWLHYTVDKMITAVHYKRTNTKIHKNYLTKLKSIKNRLLEYGSAAEFVLTDNEFSMLTN